MKIRIAKFLLKPKAAIGVSLLDVISNALASIILIFFILVAIRAQPPSPERMLGILVVDYEIQTTERPDIQIFLKKPAQGVGNYLFNDGIEALKTGEVDSIPGIWAHAVVMSVPGKENYIRRIMYMNPEKEGEWTAGIIFSDHTRYTYNDYKPFATLKIRAHFVQRDNLPRLETNVDSITVRFPTQRCEVKFKLPEYPVSD
ncbi:MAG: hypothetical protein KIS77_16885 [Saprospiraceae bacterium]|nr:hypothetical protein [Saprospiraceae bacterium]